jgi:hypothetical protein
MNGLWTLLPAIGIYVVGICLVIAAALCGLDHLRDRKDPP